MQSHIFRMMYEVMLIKHRSYTPLGVICIGGQEAGEIPIQIIKNKLSVNYCSSVICVDYPLPNSYLWVWADLKGDACCPLSSGTLSRGGEKAVCFQLGPLCV